jgi:GT2 family glycosyltransferase
MAIRKKLFLEVGGFDEKLRYNEDSDFCNRLRIYGYRLLFAPEAIVNHFMGIENYSDCLRVFRRYGYERGKNVAKKRSLLTKSNLASIASSSAMILLLTFFLLFKSGETILFLLIIMYVAVIFVFSSKLAIKKRSITLFILGPLIYTSIHSVYSISFMYGYLEETARAIKSRLKDLRTRKFSLP